MMDDSGLLLVFELSLLGVGLSVDVDVGIE
jgi:hypothetical protein